MKEIKATAPTPQDWIELVRENERLRKENYRLKRKLSTKRHVGNYLGEQNK